MPQLDAFSERARRVLGLAEIEARRLLHGYIGTEHILLGLVREGDGVAFRTLLDLGVTPERVASAVEFIVGKGAAIDGDRLSFSPRAEHVIDVATVTAQQMNSHAVGTEHLLLALLAEGEGVAVAVLRGQGASLEKVRGKLAHESQPNESTYARDAGDAKQVAPKAPVRRPAPAPRASRLNAFTERARRALTLAQEEAQRFNHNYIGTEHLLLGLVREGDGVAARVLGNMGVQLPKVRSAVEFIIGRGEGAVIGDIGLTPRAKKVLELAIDEARRLNHHYVGTEHLLLGLVREGEGIAAGVLESLGVHIDVVQEHILRLIDSGTRTGGVVGPSPPLPAPAAPAPSITPPLWFDGFSEEATRIIAYAQEEAQRFNHDYIGTEHLLLGLVRESDGLAGRVLGQMGVQLPKVRSAVVFIIGRGEAAAAGAIGLTPRSKKVIELARDEARRLRRDTVESEHLLLGLVREGEGIAAGVLESLGVVLERVRAHIERPLTEDPLTEDEKGADD